MRKLACFLFISLDGVVEAPDTFVRPELYQDFSPLIAQSIAGQDLVLMGRRMYEEWSAFWPTSDIQPFSGFINAVPKLVVSATLASTEWQGSSLLAGDVATEVARMKASEGGTIGVHGIDLIESLILAGLMDELRFVLVPVVAGNGRRLVSTTADAIQLDLASAQTTPTGLQHLVYRPRTI
jgi:dihydrofolate reductase